MAGQLSFSPRLRIRGRAEFPAGIRHCEAEGRSNLVFAGWRHLHLRAVQVLLRRCAARNDRVQRVVSDHHPKPDVVVTVMRVVPVAVRRARVVPIVVPRAAPQHAVVVRPAPAETASLPRSALQSWNQGFSRFWLPNASQSACPRSPVKGKGSTPDKSQFLKIRDRASRGFLISFRDQSDQGSGFQIRELGATTTRNPKLKSRRSGLPPKRNAARALYQLPYHAPPRNTRRSEPDSLSLPSVAA